MRRCDAEALKGYAQLRKRHCVVVSADPETQVSASLVDRVAVGEVEGSVESRSCLPNVLASLDDSASEDGGVDGLIESSGVA